MINQIYDMKLRHKFGPLFIQNMMLSNSLTLPLREGLLKFTKLVFMSYCKLTREAPVQRPV